MKKMIWLATLALVIVASVTVWLKVQNNKVEVITIGGVFDLTGSLAYMGQWSIRGAQVAVDEINEKGGINGRDIELIVEDAETSPQKAVSAFQKIVSIHKPAVVIGFNGSSEVMACAPIADRTGTVLFSTGGASPLITDAGEYVFRNRLSGALEVIEMAEFAVEKKAISRISILYINTAYGEGYMKDFRKRFIELKGKIESIDSFEQDQIDFRAQLTKLKNIQGLQAIYLVSHVREGAAILKQARELSLEVVWLASNAIEGPELIDIAGKAAEGIFYTVAYYNPDSEVAKSFNDLYKDKYGHNSEMFAANAYDAIHMLAAVYRQKEFLQGIDIKEYLENLTNFQGAAGLTNFDVNGDVVRPIAVKTVKDGNFVVSFVESK